MTDKPKGTMSDALKALWRSSSADPHLQGRVAARLAPPTEPAPIDGRAFTSALRRLTRGAPSIDEAVRLHNEAESTTRVTDRSISPPRSGPVIPLEEDR